MPTFLLQCGPNVDPIIRKVRNVDPMPPLWTFFRALNDHFNWFILKYALGPNSPPLLPPPTETQCQQYN